MHCGIVINITPSKSVVSYHELVIECTVQVCGSVCDGPTVVVVKKSDSPDCPALGVLELRNWSVQKGYRCSCNIINISYNSATASLVGNYSK